MGLNQQPTSYQTSYRGLAEISFYALSEIKVQKLSLGGGEVIST